MNPILSQTAPDGNGDDLDNEPDNDAGLVDEPTDGDNGPTDASDHK